MQTTPVLQFENISKFFVSHGSKNLVLMEVNLDVHRNEFVCIVGPSGCGKSTLLNIASGLMKPSDGEVRFENQKLSGVNPKIGYITQHDNLMPWRSLIDNVVLFAELHGIPRKQRYAAAMPLIERVGLAGYEHHYPHELSGGMKQRANIIRTLIYEPEVILMDEPFGPLDAITRLKLQALLLDLWEESKKTVLFITHDLQEAIVLADKIVVMGVHPGRILGVYENSIPRPRNILDIQDTQEFRLLHRELWRLLMDEVDHNPEERVSS